MKHTLTPKKIDQADRQIGVCPSNTQTHTVTMSDIKIAINIPKGVVMLLGYYDGTPVDIVCSRDQYQGLCDSIKAAGRRMIKKMLAVYHTEKKVGDMIIQRMDELHNKILAVTTSHVTDESLQLAWGDDWKNKVGIWMINISALLHLKRIEKSDKFGWMVMDHNSSQYVGKDGPTICVYGKDTQVLKKKVEKILKAQNKK
jgi:hypothetical protein